MELKYIPLVWEVGSDMLLNVETYRIKLGENAIKGFDSLGNIFIWGCMFQGRRWTFARFVGEFDSLQLHKLVRKKY